VAADARWNAISGTARNTERLEHDPEKWIPVFREDHALLKHPDHNPIQFDGKWSGGLTSADREFSQARLLRNRRRDCLPARRQRQSPQ
jgi:hypothetical protein